MVQQDQTTAKKQFALILTVIHITNTKPSAFDSL